jgi:phage terminase small subunit
MAPKRTKAIEKCTIRQRKFIEEVMKPDMSHTQAIINAGYKPANANSAHVLAHDTLSSRNVQAAISEILKERYPDIGNDAAKVLNNILLDSEASNGDKMKAIELLAKFFGWHAPTKHQRLNASIKYKLPGEVE